MSESRQQNYVGRLAPSPTGAQHLGNARTFLIAWLHCRIHQGTLLLRIEDLDTPRTKPGADSQAIEDLQWLGLDWDAPVVSDRAFPIALQSQRQARFDSILKQLQELHLVYPCTCSRSDVERASSAPHEASLDGMIYPGTCSLKDVSRDFDSNRDQPVAWRFRMQEGEMAFYDALFGRQQLDAKRFLGDFIVARSYGGTAYQLAVVIDDHDFGVNCVVRGADLIYSTFRQMALYQALDWKLPNWFHVPLVVGSDGRRLAKRHGDTRLSHYRKQGVHPERLVALLANSLGFETPERITPHELLAIAKQKPDWIDSLSKQPFIVDANWLEGGILPQ
jgi:glutamyl-tRNA synthetase